MNQGRVIRLLIIGLPLGLAAMLAASVFLTHGRKIFGWGDAAYLTENDRVETAPAVGRVLQKGVEEAMLRRTHDILTVKIGERNLANFDNLQAAAYFIESSMGQNNMGYQMTRQEYTVEGKPVWNLEGRLPGGKAGREVVVVGAHYDSAKGSPGADDNASGVAALMAVAQALSGVSLNREVRFVVFVNGAIPGFQTDSMGSLVYARSCKARGDHLVAMLSLDTLGCYLDAPGSQRYPEGIDATGLPTVGNFLAVVGDEAAPELVERIREAFQRHSSFPLVAAALPGGVPGVADSDHWSFWQNGYPGVLITDTAGYRYPEFGTAQDTPQRIDFARLTEVTKGLVEVVKALATE